MISFFSRQLIQDIQDADSSFKVVSSDTLFTQGDKKPPRRVARDERSPLRVDDGGERRRVNVAIFKKSNNARLEREQRSLHHDDDRADARPPRNDRKDGRSPVRVESSPHHNDDRTKARSPLREDRKGERSPHRTDRLRRDVNRPFFDIFRRGDDGKDERSPRHDKWTPQRREDDRKDRSPPARRTSKESVSKDARADRSPQVRRASKELVTEDAPVRRARTSKESVSKDDRKERSPPARRTSKESVSKDAPARRTSKESVFEDASDRRTSKESVSTTLSSAPLTAASRGSISSISSQEVGKKYER